MNKFLVQPENRYYKIFHSNGTVSEIKYNLDRYIAVKKIVDAQPSVVVGDTIYEPPLDNS